MSKVRNCGAENGVRNASLWRALLGVEKTVVEDIEFDEDAQIVVAHVRPARASKIGPSAGTACEASRHCRLCSRKV